MAFCNCRRHVSNVFGRLVSVGLVVALGLSAARAQQYDTQSTDRYLHGRSPRAGGAARTDPAAPSPAPQGGEYRGSEEDQQACTGDVLRLCQQFIPDVTRIVTCLQSQRRSLTPACGAVFARRR